MSKVIAVLAVSTGLLALSAPANASPSAGCPAGESGFALWNVDTEPYRADNAADAAGNGDGWVCARAGKVVTDESGEPFQLYTFIDNRVAS